MPERVFKVGDKVRVRDWDDMVQEYGLYECDINSKIPFLIDMRIYCGMEFIVREIRERYESLVYLFEEDAAYINQWLITGEMLEPAKNRFDNINGISSLFE